MFHSSARISPNKDDSHILYMSFREIINELKCFPTPTQVVFKTHFYNRCVLYMLLLASQEYLLYMHQWVDITILFTHLHSSYQFIPRAYLHFIVSFNFYVPGEWGRFARGPAGDTPLVPPVSLRPIRMMMPGGVGQGPIPFLGGIVGRGEAAVAAGEPAVSAHFFAQDFPRGIAPVGG